MTQSPQWRKLLLTDEEHEQRIRENYHLDEDGNIIAEKTTFSQRARHNKIDLYPTVDVDDYANALFDIMERKKSLTRQ